MRTLSIGLLVPTVLVLTACPGPDDPEDVEVPPAAEQTQLEQLQGSGVTGEVAVTARDNETHIVVEVRNAMADETYEARIHSGTCQNPGPEIRNVGSIRTTDMGSGAIDTTVGEAPALLMDGNHIVVIWGPDVNGQPAATDPAAPGDGTAAQQDPAAQQQDPAVQQQRQDTGLMRDGRRAVACTTLPRHAAGTQQY